MKRDEKGKWQTGQSGNPAGRPRKGETMTDALKARVDAGAIAEKLIKLALADDLGALKYIYDRVDGRPVETINQTIKEIPEFVRFDDEDDPEDREADQE